MGVFDGLGSLATRDGGQFRFRLYTLPDCRHSRQRAVDDVRFGMIRRRREWRVPGDDAAARDLEMKQWRRGSPRAAAGLLNSLLVHPAAHQMREAPHHGPALVTRREDSFHRLGPMALAVLAEVELQFAVEGACGAWPHLAHAAPMMVRAAEFQRGLLERDSNARSAKPRRARLRAHASKELIEFDTRRRAHLAFRHLLLLPLWRPGAGMAAPSGYMRKVVT